ncbi:MAG: hypothetical protein ACXVFN_18305 [Solirubrobacteraceae bacterium]
MRQRAVLLTAALVLGLVAVPTAQANIRHTFDLRTGTKETKGRARAHGAVTFLGEQVYHQVKVTGRVNDICPADGHSAVLSVSYQFGDGSYIRRYVVDARTCGTAAKTFSFRSRRFKHAIESVGLGLDEVSHDANGVPTDYADSDQTALYPIP